MYEDRDQVRVFPVMVRLNAYQHEVAKACAKYRKMQLSSYLHWALMKELSQVIGEESDADQPELRVSKQ